jgi:hypothetical protein
MSNKQGTVYGLQFPVDGRSKAEIPTCRDLRLKKKAMESLQIDQMDSW